MIKRKLAAIFLLAAIALGVAAQVTPNCSLTGVFYQGCAIQATTIDGTTITASTGFVAPPGTATSGGYRWTGFNMGLYVGTTNDLYISLSNAPYYSFSTARFQSSNPVAFTGGSIGSASDLGISRISAGVLGVGNGTAADISGQVKAASVVLGTGSTLSTYIDGTFTATATGGTTSPTGTVAYTVVGKNVTLYVPAFSFTSNASTYTLTGAPAAIIPPSSTTEWICPTIDNGAAAAMATCRIAVTTGVISLFKDIATNSFTTSGTKGNPAFSISYVLR